MFSSVCLMSPLFHKASTPWDPPPPPPQKKKKLPTLAVHNQSQYSELIKRAFEFPGTKMSII